MSKKSLSSLELSAIVNELQFLVKGKIFQIYHQEKEELVLQLHARERGKQFLRIVPGKFICLTEKKEAPLKPSSFCMQLRKYLDNAFIKSIYQKGSERIVIIELEKADKFQLIVELFSKGNIVLTDEHLVIIAVLMQQVWKDRTVKVKEKYIFPLQEINWKEINEPKLKQVLAKSEKRNLATSLAIELGMGGVYAEEVCKANKIDYKKRPQETSDEEVKEIVKAIKEFLKKIETPKGYFYGEEINEKTASKISEDITPFPLFGRTIKKTAETYNEAINTIQPVEIISPYEKSIKTLQKTILEQEEAIKHLQGNIEANSKKGELIYEKYSPLQRLLEIVKEMRKTKEWKEIAEELKKEKKIKAVDLKEKKVIIDL